MHDVPTFPQTFEMGSYNHYMHSVALLAVPMTRWPTMVSSDVKIGIKIGSDWPQIGQIWDLRSVSVDFGSANLTQFGCQI